MITTVNSRLMDTPLLRTPAIMDKIQPSPGGSYRGLTENYSRYCGLSLLRTPNYVPRVSAITKVDCTGNKLLLVECYFMASYHC